MARVQDVINKEIPEVRKGIKDSVGQQRLRVCEFNYDAAYSKFQGALISSDSGAYNDVGNWVNAAKKLIIDCENNYWGNQPIIIPLIADTNQRTLNLAALILSINDMLKG